MKWFFAINEQSVDFEQYSQMLKVAVLTAQKHTSLQPHLLYDGMENDLTEWLKSRNVVIIKRRSFLYDKLAEIAEKRNNIKYLTIGSGAFLRVEIPQIAQELSINDKYVVYTDLDVMFLKDPTKDFEEHNPKYFAVTPETDINNFIHINTGVMLMNLKKLRSVDSKFRHFIIQNINSLVDRSWDQGAYQQYFRTFFGGYKWEIMPLEFNWKPYWGENQFAKIIHFHGPKPQHKQAFMSSEVPNDIKSLLPLVNDSYFELCKVWEDYSAMT